MPRYAQIIAGRVHWIFEAPANPYTDPKLDIRDVTAVVPPPQEGWRVLQGDTFEAPPVVPATPATRMSRLAFRTRFTEAEQVAFEAAMESHPQPNVRAALRVFDKNLSDSTEIDLLDPRTQLGLQRLVQFGLLTQVRADEILDPAWSPVA